MPDTPTDAVTKAEADRPSVPTVIVNNADGVRQLAATESLSGIVSAGKLNWVDIVCEDKAEQSRLLQEFGLNATEQSWLQLFGQAGRLLLDRYKVRAVTWLAERQDLLAEVHVLGTEGLVLTLWSGNPARLDAMRSHFAARAGELQRSFHRAAAIVLQLLLATLHEAVFEIDEEGGRTLRNLYSGRATLQVQDLRLRIFLLRSVWSNIDRYRGVVRLAVTGVEALPGIDPDAASELNDYADRVDDLENRLHDRSRWASEIVQDYANNVAQRQSDQISRLTIVSTVFLPITFLTGFFGMNFTWMNTYLDTSAAFFLLGVLLPVVCVGLTVQWFKRRALL